MKQIVAVSKEPKRPKSFLSRWMVFSLVTVIGCLTIPPSSAVEASHGYPPAKWILGPIYATGCPTWANCPNPNGATMVAEVNYDLDNLAHYDIPITVYHFDGNAWSSGDCRWALGNPLIERLRTSNVRALLHVWGGCDTPEKLNALYSQLGNVLGGIYLDEGSKDAQAKLITDFMQSALPGNGEVVMKAYQGDRLQTDEGLSAYGHTAYVNDLPSDFSGLREGIRRVLSKADLLPAPYNEFTGYDGRATPSEEVYIRRLHWGAMQMVMEQDCPKDCDPWRLPYSPALLRAYQYYAWLHEELAAYLYSYDYQAYETDGTVFRESDATQYTTKLGEELFVAYVTEPDLTHLSITLPAGQWINYWNETEVFAGGSTIHYPVPLGQEPIFIRDGALIPMQVERNYTGHGTALSAGSLTVLVYPSGNSSFHYRDEGYWVTFNSSLNGDKLTLNAMPTPSQPVLYRIGRWPSVPSMIGVIGTTVTVNEGGAVTRVTSEEAVNGATANAWYYDSVTQRLIIKVIPSVSPAPNRTVLFGVLLALMLIIGAFFAVRIWRTSNGPKLK